MISTNTYIKETIPYFYIIQHKISKKMYAGSRLAKGCHPDEFMQIGGYTTSSKIINLIIEQEGLESFDILRIDTNLDMLSAYEYETTFLKCIDCSGSDNWYNAHNNMGMSFGLPEFYDKSKQTLFDNYGVTHNSQIPEVRDNIKQTLFVNYGVEHNSQIPEVKQNKINKSQSKYGVDNVFQNEEIKEKSKRTMLEKTGFDNASKVKEFQEKKKQTSMKNFGFEYASQSQEIKDRVKSTNIEKSGYDNPSKVPFLSIIETKRTYAKCAISVWFKEFKQFY